MPKEMKEIFAELQQLEKDLNKRVFKKSIGEALETGDLIEIHRYQTKQQCFISLRDEYLRLAFVASRSAVTQPQVLTMLQGAAAASQSAKANTVREDYIPPNLLKEHEIIEGAYSQLKTHLGEQVKFDNRSHREILKLEKQFAHIKPVLRSEESLAKIKKNNTIYFDLLDLKEKHSGEEKGYEVVRKFCVENGLLPEAEETYREEASQKINKLRIQRTQIASLRDRHPDYKTMMYGGGKSQTIKDFDEKIFEIDDKINEIREGVSKDIRALYKQEHQASPLPSPKT